MKWFRYWAEALDDEKVQSLPAWLFKHWVNILCVACHNKGEIEGVNQAAFRLRVSPKRARQIIDELVKRGLLDNGGEGWAPHNWAGRQFSSDDVTSRVRKHRQGVTRNVSGELDATPPDTDTENR